MTDSSVTFRTAEPASSAVETGQAPSRPGQTYSTARSDTDDAPPSLYQEINKQPYVYSFTAAQTSNWAGQNIIIGAVSIVSGTPYAQEFQLEVSGNAHPHSSYVFDPVGIFK